MDSTLDWLRLASEKTKDYASNPKNMANLGLRLYTIAQSGVAMLYGFSDTLASNLMNQKAGAFDASSGDGLVRILLMLVILFLSLKILDIFRRMILSWVLFFVKIAIWIIVVGLGVFVYFNGADTLLNKSTEVFSSEKKRWESITDQLMAQNQLKGEL